MNTKLTLHTRGDLSNVYPTTGGREIYWVDAAGIGGRNMSLPGEIWNCTRYSSRSNAKDVIFNQQKP